MLYSYVLVQVHTLGVNLVSQAGPSYPTALDVLHHILCAGDVIHC